MKYRPEIDGLRAVAVLPVILFHAGFSTFSGGFVGVDVFFVISGYLITSIILKDLEAGSFSFWEFYERRARRILPALFFVIICCIPFAWMWMMPMELKGFATSVVAVSVFASNILFWRQSGYFDTAAELKPLLHTWSLAVEEQFYIFVPIAMLILWRFGRKNVVAAIALVTLISLALSEYGSRYHPSFNFYWLPTRAWELAAGSLCAFVAIKSKAMRDDLLSVAGLLAILVSVFYYDQTTPFPSLYALLPVLGTCAIILFARQGTIVGSLLSLKPFVGIGLISYSAYLWHQPLFAFARIRSLSEPTWQLMLLLAVCSLVLAYFSWRYIEVPARRRSLINGRVLFYSVSVASSVLILCGLYGRLISDQAVTDPVAQFTRTFNITKGHWDKRPDIMLIGDSHADHLLYGLRYTLGDRIVDASSAGCIPFLGVDRYDSRFTPGDCEISMRKRLNEFLASSQLRTIILSSMGPVYLDGSVFRGKDEARVTGDGVTLLSEPQLRDRWKVYEKGMRSTLDALTSVSGKSVIFSLDVPELGLDPRECRSYKSTFVFLETEFATSRPSYENCSISREEYNVRVGKYHRLVRAVLQDYPSVQLFDPTSLFCNSDMCAGTLGGFELYRDPDHLSEFGSLKVANEIAKLIQ